MEISKRVPPIVYWTTREYLLKKFKYTRQAVLSGYVEVRHIPGKDNPADALTKNLGRVIRLRHREVLHGRVAATLPKGSLTASRETIAAYEATTGCGPPSNRVRGSVRLEERLRDSVCEDSDLNCFSVVTVSAEQSDVNDKCYSQ